MGSPIAPLHLTLGDLEGQSSGHQNYEALYLAKERSWALMLLLNIDWWVGESGL